MSWIVTKLRAARVVGRQMVGLDPVVRPRGGVPLEYHGGPAGGWSIASGLLNDRSVVVDVGLGEDLSFPHSIIDRYGCAVHGFDPTPRAIAYAKEHSRPQLRVYELGLGAQNGNAELFLPVRGEFVSGSIHRGSHLRGSGVPIALVSMDGLFERIAADHIDLLKLDIEGAEFDVIASAAFAHRAGQIRQLCVEFHHRWHEGGRQATESAVRTLEGLGFECVWYESTTNEEFTFLRVGEMF
jgi:FkbM family methyltransferase